MYNVIFNCNCIIKERYYWYIFVFISEILSVIFTFQGSIIIYFNGLWWLDQHLLSYSMVKQAQDRHLALHLTAGLHRLQQWGRNDPVRLFALTCGRLPRTWDCYSIHPASTEAVSPSTLVNTG